MAEAFETTLRRDLSSNEAKDAAALQNLRTPVWRGVSPRARSVVAAVLVAALTACSPDAGGSSSGEIAVRLPSQPPTIESADTDVVAAQLELSEGRAWAATKRMVPVARRSARRTPEVMLVTARAMAAWEGWDEVRKALEPEPWLDLHFDGEGYELLARSALERSDEAAARSHAETALRLARDPTARAVRLVLLARALDRLAQRDSAAALYRRAADALPVVREWLWLRQAGMTRVPEERERIYSRLRLAASRARIAHTEAQALERFRQDQGAAAAYEKLGDMPSSYRLRLSSGYDPALRSGVRAGLLGYLQRDATGENLQRGVEVLDAAFPRLDETSELLVARLAAARGLHGRAAAGFTRVPRAQLTDADVVLWARALIAVGRPRAADSVILARPLAAGPAAAEARYVRAYALVRAGAVTPARAAIARVLTRHAATTFAADARYLLADLEIDAGRDTRARTLLDAACSANPPGVYTDDACMRAGVLALALGNARRAAAVLDSLPRRFPQSVDVIAALYWAGRAWERAGDSARARDRWRDVIRRDPISYYATRSAVRLDTSVWSPVLASAPPSPLYQVALNRANALRQLGMYAEEGYELDEIERETIATPRLALGAGATLLERGDVARAIRIGWRIVRDTAGRVDDRGYLLVFPILREAELIARARANDLDPALVAAVIRQESGWNPKAGSRANALGLMQILPRVGEEIARGRRYPAWDPALLFIPDVSLELGTAHLGAALRRWTDLPRALAAYNAGASRVRRWMTRAGSADPEMFVERIPYVETRDYVRIVMRNAELYRALHGLNRR